MRITGPDFSPVLTRDGEKPHTGPVKILEEAKQWKPVWGPAVGELGPVGLGADRRRTPYPSLVL